LTVSSVRRFYKFYFNAQVRVDGCGAAPASSFPLPQAAPQARSAPHPAGAAVGAGRCCTVQVGANQWLQFMESDPAAVTPYDGHHLCLYTADLPAVYNKLAEQGLNWNNPRFAHLK
jgi:hypothetical protein